MLLAGSVSQALQRRGYWVDWHVDLQTAIQYTDRYKTDAVILDLLLAGRTGIEFLYELRSYPDWRDLPVIIYSHVTPAEIMPSLDGLNDLNIAAFHHKSHTSLDQLVESVDGILHHELLRH